MTTRNALDSADKVNLFAVAFVHACDDEGTYFGLGKEFYDLAKSWVTPEAEAVIRRLLSDEFSG